jgi:hypothetical protein
MKRPADKRPAAVERLLENTYFIIFICFKADYGRLPYVALMPCYSYALELKRSVIWNMA